MKYQMGLSLRNKQGLGLLIACVLLCCNLLLAAQKDYSPFPNPDAGYVTDIAGVLTDEEEDRIESWLYTTEKRTNVEIVVFVINSIVDYPGTPNDSIEAFANRLFNAYGIGNMPRNDGVLLLVAIRDRKVRIELGAAYGRSRDLDASKIIDRKILPHFRESRYAEGIKAGTRAAMRQFAGVWLIPGWVKLVVVALIVLLILVTISLFRRGKRGWGWVCAGLVIVLILVLVRLIRTTVEHLPKDAGAGGFWGGGFGGGGGGGGGGSGGGGGASGGW